MKGKRRDRGASEPGVSEIWRDPKVRLIGEGEREGKGWGIGIPIPCWELGLGDGAEEEDEDAAWVCEGKMDMKVLEGGV